MPHTLASGHFPLSVMDHSPHGVILFDEAWQYRYVNPAAAAMIRADAASLIGRVIWEVFPHIVGGPFDALLRATMAGEVRPAVTSFEATLQRWYEVSAFRWHGGVAVYVSDVTDTQATVAELVASRRQLADAQRIARLGNWHWHIASGRLTWSDESYRLAGVDRAVTPHFGLLRGVIHPDDFARMEAAIAEALSGRAPYALDLRLTPPGEPPFEVHVRGEVERDAAGIPVAMFGTMQDVSDQRRIERELRANRDVMARLHQVARVAAWSFDLAAGTVQWSPESYMLWGLDPATFTVTPASFQSLVHPEDRERMQDVVTRNLAAPDGVYDVRFRGIRGDGSVRHFRAVGEVLRDAQGVPAQIRGLTIDETEQVEAEAERRTLDAQLQQAQRLESLGVLAGGIAHDFNNLLVGILGNATMALDDLPPDAAARTAIEGIETAARRAADLTRQLLAYSGKGRFVIERLDVSDCLREMSALLAAAVDRRIVLTLDLAPEPVFVEGDATQLRQVFMNLLTNAAEAMAETGGEVVVRTSRRHVAGGTVIAADGAEVPPAEYACVEVQDAGPGIPPGAIPRIFEPFYTTKFTGRGLGLSATLGIVRGHRGAIVVHSQVGRGTTMCVLLPLVGGAKRTSGATAGMPEAALEAGGTVLVVDDDAAVRSVVRAMLGRRGHTILEAADGEEGLATFAAHADEIRLVLLDLTMPRLDGPAVLRRLRARPSSVPVILMSGYDESDLAAGLREAAGAGFVQKPFRAADLYRAVGAALARA